MTKSNVKKPKTMIYFMNSQDTAEITYGLKIRIRHAIEATLCYEGYNNDCQLSVTFTDNEGIRALNKEYRGKDSATDVLSFPLLDFTGSEEPPIDEPMQSLGDIVLSLERADEQAKEYGHSFERETAFLTVHSMLHLLGYDHELSDEDDAEMRRKQNEILDGMGLTR